MAKTYNFEGHLTADRSIQIPADIASQLPEGAEVHVTVMLASEAEDEFWLRMSAERFAAAYSDDEPSYDALLNDPEPR